MIINQLLTELKAEAARLVPYKVGGGQRSIQKRAEVLKRLMQEYGYPLVVPRTKGLNPKFKYYNQHPKTDSR